MPGSEPDSGKPTVRDRRGACGNVGYGSRTEACWETSRFATEPYGCARRTSIPTPLIHTSAPSESSTNYCSRFFRGKVCIKVTYSFKFGIT
jgi:hypothetical protein